MSCWRKPIGCWLILSLTGLLLAAGAWAQISEQASHDFSAAQDLYRQGNYGPAATAFAAFIRAYPDHRGIAMALFRVGECLVRTGEFSAAVPFLQRLIQEYPENLEAEAGWLWLGDAYRQSEDYLSAVAAYAFYLQQYPEGDQRGRAAYWLGESQHHLGHHTEAIAAYLQALQSPLEAPEAAYACYALGWSYLQTGDLEQALASLLRVLEQYPDSAVAAESQYLVGTVHRTRKDYPTAITAYQGVLARYPASSSAAPALAGIGSCYLEQEAYEPALNVFREVMALYPDTQTATAATLRAADCLFHLERYAEAAQLYAQIATGDTEADEALYWLGVTYEQLPENATEALTVYARLTTDFPDSPRVADSYLHIGQLQLKAGDTAAAQVAFTRAIATAQTPDQERQAQVYLAWTVYQQSKSEADLAAVEALLKQDPAPAWVPSLASQVAFAHITAEHLTQALNMLDFLATHHPEISSQGDVAYYLGTCHEKLGADQPAEDAYRRALEDTQRPEYVGLAGAALISLYVRRGDLDRALETASELQQAKAQPETIAYALGVVGDALQQAHRYAEASTVFAQVLTLAPESAAAPYAQLGLGWAQLEAGVGDPVAAFVAVTRQYPQAPAAARVPEGLLAVAERRFAGGDLKAAQATYELLLSDYPTSDLADETEYKLAWTFLKQKDAAAALEHFVAVTSRADNPAVAADARYQAARLLVGRGETARAGELLEPFRDQFVDTEVAPVALVLLGRVCLEQAQFDPATEAFQRVLDRYSQSVAIAEAWLGLAYTQHARKQYDQALSSLKQALAQAPETTAAEAQFLRATVLRDQGDYPGAVESFLQISPLGDDTQWAARARFEAGQCYELLRDPATALKTYQSLVRDFPRQPTWVQQAQTRLKALGQ